MIKMNISNLSGGMMKEIAFQPQEEDHRSSHDDDDDEN